MKIKNIILQLVFSFLLGSSLYCQTIIENGSWISGNWSVDDSPYIILGEAIIPTDSILTIEPGVEIRLNIAEDFMPATMTSSGNRSCGWFNIKGTLLAEGTVNDSIIFTRHQSSGYWGCLRYTNNNSGSILKYCRIEFGGSLDVSSISLNSSNVVIENSSVVSSGYFGIYCKYQTTSIIKSCLITNSAVGGIESFQSSTYIIDNTFSFNKNTGISLYTDNYSIVENNIVINHNEHGICVYASNSVVVRGNRITDNNWCGLHWSSSSGIINYNLISGSNSGIRISGPESVYVINNTIVDNNVIGLYFYYEAKPIILNNIIFYNPATFYFAFSNANPTVAYSLLKCESLPQACNDGGYNIFNENPLFVAPHDENFNLSGDSPCIDKGAALYIWEGDTIVNYSPEEYYGHAPDMGAFESSYIVSYAEIFNHKKIINYPNPFNNSTFININHLPVDNNFVGIINSTGSLVKSFSNSKNDAWIIEWDGTDKNGCQVSTGFYFLHYTSNGETIVCKLLLIE